MTLENTTIQAELREMSSKGKLKKGRSKGSIPGVIYHKGKSTPITVLESNLPKKHTHAGVVKLVVNGAEKTVIMREVQVDTLTDKPLHFDFQEVSPEDKIRTHVPLNFVGLTREQEKEGAFNIRVRYLEIRTKLSKLPRSIDVDVSQLKAGESVQLFDLKLPKDLFIKTGKGKNVALASIVKI
ncbi:MAG: 50S ribosomal protein L25 [Bdellovibrionota bacterium]